MQKYKVKSLNKLTNVERFVMVKNMEVKVSSKYQVVIPKAVRNKLQLKPGQRVNISRQKGGKIVIDTVSVVDRLAGSLTGVWGSEDPAKSIRRDRDQSERGPSSDRRR